MGVLDSLVFKTATGNGLSCVVVSNAKAKLPSDSNGLLVIMSPGRGSPSGETAESMCSQVNTVKRVLILT